ncbi:DUF58 domain-containing protein [Sediminibacillus halophilus]|uniref:Uncharacterized conserved protein, DUF58 family, contains vWF domain n=1 Tax=Sediminibacillus halophilus TaxID=482461 RepID=A0A1G9N3E8_9BACI|nr:DUF58 domain-containing protein [Sediminibacillus halophilus]SDL80647.1 Uncharacterized conserved protein, DUF58 family, contains vWF domain [Sediminibacillus halophilus]
MKLEKRIGDQLNYGYELMVFLVIVIFVFSIIFNRPMLFGLVAMITAYLFINRLYEKNIGNRLVIDNPAKSIRLFPGEANEISFSFNNHSRLPIMNGRLYFAIGDVIEGKGDSNEKNATHKYGIPFSMARKGKTKVCFPFTAKQRGTARIHNIHYLFPHLTGFDTIRLNFNGFYRTELIVYPEPLPVQGVQSAFVQAPGNQRAVISPFEDTMDAAGARDYVHSDSFSRIHWKATARTMRLQTKVYERSLDFTWVMVINLGETSRLGNRYFSASMEKILSQVTYFCHVAVQKGYPFEIYLNLQRPGRKRFFSIEAGSGKTHLKEALEMLARVDKNYKLETPGSLLHFVDNHMYKQKSVVFFGEMDDASKHYANKWCKQGMPVFYVEDSTETGSMKSWGEYR